MCMDCTLTPLTCPHQLAKLLYFFFQLKKKLDLYIKFLNFILTAKQMEGIYIMGIITVDYSGLQYLFYSFFSCKADIH